MKIPTFKFYSDINIYNLGDVHRGDDACNVALFRKVVNTIAEDDIGWWISTGDLLNVALKTSVSDSSKSKPLGKEFDLLIEELQPIKKRCLGIVDSNHHRRFDRAVGMSLDAVISSHVDLQIPYLGKIGVLNVVCDSAAYYIVLHHGVGFGRKRGSKANNLEELGDIIPSADVYMEGHTHSYDYFINEVPYIDKKRQLLNYHKAHFATTGHFLNWEDSYAQDFKLRPKPQGVAMVTLSANTVGRSAMKSVKCVLVS